MKTMINKSALLVLIALFPLHVFASDLVDREDVIKRPLSELPRVSLNQNNKAQRIVVFFNVYNDGKGDFHCPVKVRVVDDLCKIKTDDPAVACRDAGPTTGNHRNTSKLKWRARGESYKDSAGNVIEPIFTVTFKDNLKPCVPDDLQGWSGSRQARKKQVCKLKKADFFEGPGDNYIKYDIVGTEPKTRCAVLDPYFIVRK